MSIHRIKQVGDGQGSIRCSKCNKVLISEEEKSNAMCNFCKIKNKTESNDERIQNMKEFWKKMKIQKAKRMLGESS